MITKPWQFRSVQEGKSLFLQIIEQVLNQANEYLLCFNTKLIITNTVVTNNNNNFVCLFV